MYDTVTISILYDMYMICTFSFDVVTAVCQLLINVYVMLCYVIAVISWLHRICDCSARCAVVAL